MVKSDTTNRENGLIQRCEDDLGLGATAITSNASLYSMFVGWLNQWNKTGADYAIKSWDGADFDDKGYTKAPHGTFVGTINRDYNFDSAYKLLKLKLVQISYDGTNYVTASPMDPADKEHLATKDPSVDGLFSMDEPVYDERANGFDLYPKLTAAQVAAGANVYVEWFRAPRDFDTTSNTDSYEPCLDLQFHHFPAVGASYEYCKLYKPELAKQLKEDLYGDGVTKPGLKKEIEQWHNSKSPSNANLTVQRRVKI